MTNEHVLLGIRKFCIPSLQAINAKFIDIHDLKITVLTFATKC